MARHEVRIQQDCPRPVGDVWAVARDFCGLWHPALTSITAERSARGGLLRRFTAKGQDTVHREQLTYFSDSDRTMSYRHLEGIAGAKDYRASFSVHSISDAACRIEWQATLDGVEPRAGRIAEGTREVFEAGIAALASASAPRSLELPPAPPVVPVIKLMSGRPAIAATYVEKPGDTLCLFLHGIGGNRKNWAGQLPVAAQYMSACAMDLRGYGGSNLGSDPSTVDNSCGDILRALSGCGKRRLVLCGLSYGAWIATSFAMRHPEKLSGLVLSGGCTGMSEAAPEERERFRLSREVPLDAGKTPRDFAPDVVKVIAGPDAPEGVRRELFASMAAIPTVTYRDAIRCFTQPTERFDFAKLTMPVLFMTGEHDRLASPTELRGVSQRVHAAAAMPNVRFEVIAGAGHVCNIEQPDAYNAVLGQFLRGLSP